MSDFPSYQHNNSPNGYPQAPNPNFNGTDYPGKTLGIVAMILSLANLIILPTALIGVILGHVAYSRSKAAGYRNTFALVGIVAGWIIVGLTVLLFGFIFLLAAIGSGISAGY